MDSIDVDRSPDKAKAGANGRSDPKKSNNQIKQNQSVDKVAIGLFEQSPSSTVQDLERKLQMIRSPSESKVSQSGVEDTESESSIPPAHREYEKLLRQLEAECRNHIRCE